jgi:hypothetical protein
MDALKDFYVIAYEFYRKTNRKGGADDSALYALFMVATWFAFVVLLSIHGSCALLGVTFSKLFHRQRAVLDIEAVALIGACALASRALLKRGGDIDCPEQIRQRCAALSPCRKVIILAFAVGVPVLYAFT